MKKNITSRDVIFDEKSILVSSVENPLKNDFVIPIDAQEEIQPPIMKKKNMMIMFKKELLLCPLQGKRGRLWLQRGTLKSEIMLHMLSTLLVNSKGWMNQVHTRTHGLKWLEQVIDNHEARDGVSCQEWNLEYRWSTKEKENVGCKWIFKSKEGPSNGVAHIYKTRVVAKEFSQIEGVDFEEVLLPVVKHSSIRVKWKPQRGSTMKNKWKYNAKMNTSVYEVSWIPHPQM